ncbi:MAG: aminodeoxychorismate synthase component I [Chloroflexota bacterium]|nr:MAG: aminodeoxychorismate synthase component I [Chloroflexota bacterium]
MEKLPHTTVDDLGLPDLYVGLYDWVLAHDHLTRRTWLVADGGPEGDLRQARERLAWAVSRIDQRSAEYTAQFSTTTRSGAFAASLGTVSRSHRRAPVVQTSPVFTPVAEIDLSVESASQSLSWHASFSRAAYLGAVQKVKEYIAAGDAYQVNLTQRFDIPLPCDTWELYCILRKINPAPFAAYLHYPELQVLSASPEQFLKVENRKVETRPIKGTRPRGATSLLDRELAQELKGSTKDRAENVMIVDLLRNDLGRVCEIGSVGVTELFELEQYPTVHHLVSTVIGRLPEETDAVDLLRACFPGGSITGAPKIRAMEIIDELEPTERGVYCGAIGYLGHNGCMNTSIVIRTMVVHDGRVYFQVGGGIVADSDPECEYQETLDKAKALVMALQEAREI